MVNPCSARYYDQNMQCTFIGFVDYMCLSPRLVAYFPSQWTHIVDAARVGILKVNLHTGIPTAQRKVMVMLGLPLQNQHNFGYLRILIRWSKDISRDLCYLQQLWKHGGQDQVPYSADVMGEFGCALKGRILVQRSCLHVEVCILTS